MNKYQKYLIDKCEFVFSLGNTIEAQKCYNEEKIIITQAEDITLTKYYLKITGISIEKIYANKVASKAEFTIIDSPKSTPRHPLFTHKQLIDFDERIDTIEIQFKNGLAENLIIPVVYIEADKEAYYAKQAQLQKEAVAKKVNARFTLGSDLVNIYFQPCNDTYSRAEIELFVSGETKTACVGGPYGPANKTTVLTWDIIKKCKVAEDEFYLSVKGLAYGRYAFILKQFDTSNAVIYKTDYIEFEIKKPPEPIHEFGHVNVI